jgi:4-amino-4-deoxy-L-arabinose transferase-like glycosyltransferase
VSYFILNFNGLYSQDSHIHFRFAGELRDFLLAGTDPGPYRWWPLFYPLSGALLSLTGLPVLLSLKLVSYLALAGSVIYTIKWLRILYPGLNTLRDLYVVVFLGFSPYMFRGSLVVMTDMLSVFFIVSGCYYCYKYAREPKLLTAIFAAVFCVSAVMTRYPAIVVLLPFIITAIIALIKLPKYRYVVSIFLIVTVLSIPFLYVNRDNPFSFIDHLSHIYTNWSIANFMTHFPLDNESITSRLGLVNIIHAVHGFWFPGYFFLQSTIQFSPVPVPFLFES